MDKISEENVNVAVIDFSKFKDDMTPFYLNKAFSDIILNVDGEKIVAHKLILAARCIFFELLLLSNPDQSEIVLTNVPVDCFKKIIKYLYTGCISLNFSDLNFLFEILKLARAYSLKALVTAVSQEATSSLTTENVCLILNLANNYDFEEIRQICHTFIDEHISDILMSEPNFFNALTQKSMIKLLERDIFPLPEIEIFKIVSHWCNIHKDENNLVINCIRFSRLTRHEILNIVRPTKLVDSDKLLELLAYIEENNTSVSTITSHSLQLYKKVYNDIAVSLTSEEDLFLQRIFQISPHNM
ncbi:BTB/POZ domain-containing protein 9-like [Zophobas morio]